MVTEDSEENSYSIFKVKLVWIIIRLVLILYQEKKKYNYNYLSIIENISDKIFTSIIKYLRSRI